MIDLGDFYEQPRGRANLALRFGIPILALVVDQGLDKLGNRRFGVDRKRNGLDRSA